MISKTKRLQILKEQFAEVSKQIDEIVLNGGRVTLCDSLTRKHYTLKTKIAQARK